MTGHIEPVDVLQRFGGSDSMGSDHMNKWAIGPPIFRAEVVATPAGFFGK